MMPTDHEGDLFGWAVKDKNGRIDLRTVSPTRRGAMVNWLTLEAGMKILNSHGDALIGWWWGEEAPSQRAVLVGVLVRESPT